MQKWIMLLAMALGIGSPALAEPIIVGPGNFVRAETDRYFERTIGRAGLATLLHRRQPTPLDQQSVIRMNRDTLYSSALFDLHAGPVTVTLPQLGDGRYLSGQILSQDHHTLDVFHQGTRTYSYEDVGTRYVAVIFRVFVDADDPEDIAVGNAIQDQIVVEQDGTGTFEVPEYDKESLDQTRHALLVLAAMPRTGMGRRMGTAEEIDKVAHLLATASGWGLLPETEAAYWFGGPEAANADKVHELILQDVPAEAFWSVTVYNAQGYMVPNALGANALNNVSAVASADGTYRIQFGGCDGKVANCLPVTDGWNYALRAYRPGPAIRDGSWQVPQALPIE